MVRSDTVICCWVVAMTLPFIHAYYVMVWVIPHVYESLMCCKSHCIDKCIWLWCEWNVMSYGYSLAIWGIGKLKWKWGLWSPIFYVTLRVVVILDTRGDETTIYGVTIEFVIWLTTLRFSPTDVKVRIMLTVDQTDFSLGVGELV